MNGRPIILTLTPMHEAGMAILRSAGELRMASGTDPETIRREVADADALVIRTSGVIDRSVMTAGTRLRVIGRHGVGYDQVDIPAATDLGIQVVYTPGANTQAVAEHAIAMLIALSKHFPQQSRALIEGRYSERTKLTGRDLRGRSLGIVGFGRIGRRLGEIAHRGFGMKVFFHDIIDPPAHAVEAAAAVPMGLEALLSESEYVSLHVPLDATTRRLIDPETLALMRPEAILLNTCRGPVVDERAVADALDAGRLAGYGADVYDREPPPSDHPLIGRTDNVLLTPHCAAQTIESLVNMAKGVAEDVAGVLRGEAPLNPVNDPSAVAASRARLGLPPSV